MKKDVCIIVPFRNRAEHLNIFAPHINSFLANQNLSYKILIVEQTDEKPFNRAKLLNIGYDYVKDQFKNYVFHDVDMIPIEKKASYEVVETPTHYAAIVEQFGWNLAYEQYVGGVTAFDDDSFKKINGFSNQYFGWGAEDDDLYRRCEISGVKFMRRQNMYSSLNHDRPIIKELYHKNLNLLGTWQDRVKTDGLNNLNYEILNIAENPLYTQITVEI